MDTYIMELHVCMGDAPNFGKKNTKNYQLRGLRRNYEYRTRVFYKYTTIEVPGGSQRARPDGNKREMVRFGRTEPPAMLLSQASGHATLSPCISWAVA